MPDLTSPMQRAAFIILPSWLVGGKSNIDLTLYIGHSALVGMSHLLLDALTQGGVFFVGRRIAIAHFSYNNPILNYTFISIGLVLTFFGLL